MSNGNTAFPYLRTMMLSGTALAFVALAPVAAWAQDAVAGQEIVVTGEGLATPPGDAAYATVTIDRARLQSSGSGRFEDVLRDVAGIAQFRRSDSTSAHPTSQGVTLRGLGGNASSRALLLLDGVPQADPFGGWVPFPAYMSERLAGVRVTRGGGSGFAGPGALAGTIEMTSGRPSDLGKLRTDLWYGSRESYDATLVGSANLGSGFVTLAGEYARGDGFIPIVAESRGRADRAAPYEQASLALRAVTRVGATTEVQANISGFTDTRDRGINFTDIDSKGVDASVRLVGRGSWGWSALAYVQTRNFASGFASTDAARNTATATLNQYSVPSSGIGARVEVQPPLGAGTTLRLGADVRRVNGQTEELFTYVAGNPTRRREAGGNSLTAGGFADLSIERGGLTLDLAGRLDRWTIGDGRLLEYPIAGGTAVTNSRFADRSGWQATGRAGAAYKIGGVAAVRAAGYRGWRLPTLNELYRPFRAGTDATAANAGLAPETLVGAEAGLDLTPLPALTARATVFWNRLDHAIANVTLGTGPGTFPGAGFVAAGGAYRQRQNLDAVEATGFELDLGWRQGPLWLSASYAYTDAKVQASGVAKSLNGLRPAQTAKHQGSATIGWLRDALGGSLTARYAGPQFEDDQNARVLHKAFTVDAYLSVPLAKGFAVIARGENLFDERIEAGNTGNNVVERATPRTLWLGLSYRLR